MKVVYNNYIPFRPFLATNILGIVFCRKDRGPLSDVLKNHEHIHTLQQKEMLYVGFYVWYVIEWLIRLAMYRNAMKAYRNIAFEREAYRMQGDLEYVKHRRFFAWMRM